MTEVFGRCSARFDPLRALLDENLRAERDHGAALAVVLDGEPVVDLWGGHLDAGRTRPWQPDSLVVIKSITKGLLAICGNLCIERGLLDPAAPVARYWPEFAAAGKERLLVQHVFEHSAGLPDLPGFGAERYGDLDAACEALAAQAPRWEPGTAHAYHAVTFGWLLAELIRRVTGSRPNQFLQDEICTPLEVEAWIGAPPEVDSRLADVVPEDPIALDRRAEVASSNGFSNARALARVFGVLARDGAGDDAQLLDRRTIIDATATALTGPWATPVPEILQSLRFARGFELSSTTTYMGPNPMAFGHTGAGGSIAWADPERRLGFAYTPNRFEWNLDQMYERANRYSRSAIACVE